MKRILFLLIAVIVVGIVATSCSKNKLVGKWLATNVSNPAESCTFTFNENGTGNADIYTNGKLVETDKFDYTYENDILSLAVEGEKVTIIIIWDNHNRFIGTSDGKSVAFVRQ